ncbi:MAG: hypothetical protein R3293_28105 [Candidatus Promineifilaceae bacterium]|nr:hypothetical protein [Candidatus Promineifilaceae bacterium]
MPGQGALRLEHVGSTAVRGLAARRELAARTSKYTQIYADARSPAVEEILARARRTGSGEGWPDEIRKYWQKYSVV